MITPHWNSYGAVQDPAHQWPPVCEYSYHYFNRRWRELMQLAHYYANVAYELHVRLTKRA